MNIGIQSPHGHSVNAQMAVDTEGSENNSEPAQVVKDFLRSQSLDQFAEKAEPVVTDILKALTNEESIPHKAYGMNMLHWAAVAGDCEALNKMIEWMPAEEFLKLMNQKNEAALKMGEASILRPASGALYSVINGDTPLGIALLFENTKNTIEGQKSVAETLIDYFKKNNLELDKRACNESGYSLLHLAASGAGESTVKGLSDLLGKEVMPELINQQASSDESTPLHNAVISGKPGVFKWLVDNGAEGSLSIKDRGTQTPSGYFPLRVGKLGEESSKLEFMHNIDRSEADNLKMKCLQGEVDEWETIQFSGKYNRVDIGHESPVPLLASIFGTVVLQNKQQSSQ